MTDAAPPASTTSPAASAFRVTHADLGTMCGMTRATISRVLGKLDEEGAIELHYGRIHLRDPDALLRHLEGDAG